MKLVLASLLGLFLFTGCAEKNLNIKTKEQERIKLDLQEPSKVNMKHVNFIIITDKNAERVFKELKASKKHPVLIGITAEDYEKMSYNLQEIKHYIIKQRNNIKSYKEYYESK